MSNESNNPSLTIPAEFKSTTTDEPIVLSDEQYASLTEDTNNEQLAKLQCFDIQEYVNGLEAQKASIEDAIQSANEQLESARQNLAAAREQLKSKFDEIFGPIGLANKMVTISRESPHVVTVVDSQPAEAE